MSQWLCFQKREKTLEEVLHHDLRQETVREKQGPVPFWERPEPWVFLLCFWVSGSVL